MASVPLPLGSRLMPLFRLLARGMKCVLPLGVLVLLVFPTPSVGDELLLEWTRELPAASPQRAVEHYLEDRGIRPVVREGGLTYTSKIVTPLRDYLFCNGRLSSIIEGEGVGGARFNYWMTVFLAAQQEYGDPTTVEYDDDWRQIKFQWKLAGDTALYFLLRGASPDTIIWTRELIHEPSSRPCS